MGIGPFLAGNLRLCQLRSRYLAALCRRAERRGEVRRRRAALGRPRPARPSLGQRPVAVAKEAGKAAEDGGTAGRRRHVEADLSDAQVHRPVGAAKPLVGAPAVPRGLRPAGPNYQK